MRLFLWKRASQAFFHHKRHKRHARARSGFARSTSHTLLHMLLSSSRLDLPYSPLLFAHAPYSPPHTPPLLPIHPSPPVHVHTPLPSCPCPHPSPLLSMSTPLSPLHLQDHISQPLYDPATGKPPSASSPLASGATSCTGNEEQCKGQTESSFLGSCNCKPWSTGADCSGYVEDQRIIR